MPAGKIASYVKKRVKKRIEERKDSLVGRAVRGGKALEAGRKRRKQRKAENVGGWNIYRGDRRNDD